MIDSWRAACSACRVDLMYTPTAVVIGIVSVNLPFMVLTLQSVFEGIDTRLEEAAQGLGAAPARAFWRVVWPLALPGIGIAGILCFILSMNAYATPVLLGGPRFQMMAPLLYWEFGTNNNWPFAAALAFILMATTLLLTLPPTSSSPAATASEGDACKWHRSCSPVAACSTPPTMRCSTAWRC